MRQSGAMPPALRLEWNEAGGAAPAVPAQTGYGTSVIRNLIPYELGGAVDHVIAPDGVYCTITIPAEHTTLGDQTSASREDLAAVLS
jgi:two-component sensor histidine kinase